MLSASVRHAWSSPRGGGRDALNSGSDLPANAVLVLCSDLKPSNILIDMNGRAKIADFGLARYKLRTHLSTRNLEAGTTPYLPPEVFDQHAKHLTDRSDIYSLGM
jgi:hypothetical protein